MLHEQTYFIVRDETSLQSSLVQSAAISPPPSQTAKAASLKASKSKFRGSVVVYNGRTITYNDDHVTLATVGDRVTAKFVTSEDDQGTPFVEYWKDD